MASIPVHTDLDMVGSAKVTNLPAPTAPGDAVPKSYADALVGGGGGVELGTIIAVGQRCFFN